MAETTSYDELPYGNHIFSYSHPDRLATVATLLGMQPAPVDRCRVLELGCGTGANLMPMALALPGCQFVGLDLSSRQVEMGREVQQQLGLKNIELQAMSILDVDASLGRFDYIICHGVYSWVGPEVQDKILGICSANLAPNGVAYVSYNTYPGWHVRSMVREMMRYHVKQFDTAQERIQQAWGLLDFLIESVSDQDGLYGRILKLEKEVLASAPPTYLYHEHLEDANHPVYFHQFVERAKGKGLQYLSEARFMPLSASLSKKTIATLEQLAGDLVQGEQYLDFVRNRRFRWTLLCHENVKLTRPPAARHVPAMRVTGVVKPVSEKPDVFSSASEEFATPEGTTLVTSNPLFKTALCILARSWPRAVPFTALWEQTRVQLAAAGLPAASEDGQALAETMLQCFLSDIVDLHLHGARLTTTVGAHPCVSPIARLYASQETRLPNLRHRMVELANDFERQVLILLDGTRGKAELMDDLQNAFVEGTLEIHRGDEPITDIGELRELITSFLEPTLEKFANLGLLME